MTDPIKSSAEGLPIVAWEHINKYTGDCWGPLTPRDPAQALIDFLCSENARLKSEAQERALQYLSDNGQWIEETGRLHSALDIATDALDHYLHGGSEYRKVADSALTRISALKAGKDRP